MPTLKKNPLGVSERRMKARVFLSMAHTAAEEIDCSLKDLAFWLLYVVAMNAAKKEVLEIRANRHLPDGRKKEAEVRKPENEIDVLCDTDRDDSWNVVSSYYEDMHNVGRTYDPEWRVPFVKKKRM